MIEVAPGLYVGNQLDYETQVKGKAGWAVVQACKEPYHRAAVGYKSQGAPKDHDEYLFARRDDKDGKPGLCPRIILNMVDAPKPEFFRDEMIDAALDFIHRHRGTGTNLLIHCNQGHSRAPSLAMLHLRRWGDPICAGSFEEAEERFRDIYPTYEPAAGIRAYVAQHWNAGEHDDDTSQGSVTVGRV